MPLFSVKSSDELPQCGLTNWQCAVAPRESHTTDWLFRSALRGKNKLVILFERGSYSRW